MLLNVDVIVCVDCMTSVFEFGRVASVVTEFVSSFVVVCVVSSFASFCFISIFSENCCCG